MINPGSTCTEYTYVCSAGMGHAPSLAVMMNGKKPEALATPFQHTWAVSGLVPL